MLTYNTSFTGAAPKSSPLPKSPSPYKAYGPNHADVYAGMIGTNAANMNVAQAKAAAAHEVNRQNAENQLVLAGLQQMNTAQQNANEVANQQSGQMTNLLGGGGGVGGGLFGNIVNGLLGGLFS